MDNILITSAGRRVSLVRFFKDELTFAFPDAKVLTTDANPQLSSACQISDGYFKTRRVTEEGYIPELLQLARENGVRMIVPTIDTELLVLAQSIDLFRMNNIVVVVPDYDKVRIFRDKRLTHGFFSAHGIGCAKEYDRDDYELPMYLKPLDGSRSVDNYVITHKNQLTEYHLSNEKLLFLEYLDHKKHTEYTIDLYYDRNGDLKCFVPRKRIEVRDGEVNKAVTKRMPFMHELWRKLAHVDGFRGCITFQVFVNNETEALYGIEINPRFGGGYPLSYLAGANFAKWLIDEYLLDKHNLPECHDWEENLMMLRYDDEVLVRNYTH
jgi:carbamoyl-phosphate synthase large subunit